MSWLQIVASVFWAAAAVVVVAWYMMKFHRERRTSSGAERRAFPRPPIGFRATLSVQKKDGTSEIIKARGYDLNKFGAMVTSKYPIGPGTAVFVEIPAYRLMGIGHVRHCTAQHLKFWIGMEFRSQLMRTQEGTWAVSVVNESATAAPVDKPLSVRTAAEPEAEVPLAVGWMASPNQPS